MQVTVAYNPLAFPSFDTKQRASRGRHGTIASLHGYGYFERYFDGNAVLENVQFTTSPGFRLGCLPTGVLGFAKGNLVSENNDPQVTLGHAIAIKFNGQFFVRRDTDERIDTCEKLLLTP